MRGIGRRKHFAEPAQKLVERMRTQDSTKKDSNRVKPSDTGLRKDNALSQLAYYAAAIYE
ncbi:hypothetical protein CY34DRAFT_810517 [Suillus luteus UH-Slu-Lm8-n1]|uniref:Uncharacterized protein n=1 Tax=Suillus luteus UH-Slu-Lm8-n1 TaxID=930992 RepID=A0A0D0A6J8_9AGAM|nr:hypothetical protein CY34DRAFT_810517 [Suillus luteus UH-Slu-Lm8-n1]